MPTHPLIQKIRTFLQAGADDKTRRSFQRFFKEAVKFYGTSSARVSQIAKDYYPVDLTKPEIFALCEMLLKSGYCEEAWIAAGWAYRLHEQFIPQDFELFASWIEKYIDNWAECDTFCNHTLGTFIEMYPEFLVNLKQWTSSKNRWVKRASAVTLIIPAKKGKFLTDIFDIANALLLDSDDMVQKGYGWLLKEASRQHEAEVFAYVVRHKAVMPRTALRYAIEKMPPNLRTQAMKK